MLHILILKILGVILLVILGILFLPIRYRFEAVTDKGLEHLSVNMRITWFFHLLSAIVKYERNTSDVNLRVAWKHINVTTKATEKKEKEPKTKQKKEKKIGNFKCTITKICDTIKLICETKEKAVDFLTNKIHIAALEKVKKEVFLLAKRIRPRKIKGFVRFGLEDPYNTGQVLAVLSVLYPFYGENIEIYPEFEQEILEGNILIVGNIKVFDLLLAVCKIILNKNVQKTFKHLKSFKK